jgi:hypothetical protein
MEELFALEPRVEATEAPEFDIPFDETSAGGRCGVTTHTLTRLGC